MLIADAQVHIWSAGPPTNRMHRQVNAYTAEECIRDMDAAGVNACLLHPPGWDPNSGKISEEAAAKYPSRFGILGNFPLDKPESRSLIDTWKQRPGMLGLRFAFTQPHQANWMTDGTMDWLWPAAEKAGIPVALMASNQLPLVGQIAERHPGLKLIIIITRGYATPLMTPRTPINRHCWRSPNTRTLRSNAPGAGQLEPALPLSQYSQIHAADRRDLRAPA
jgi:predicted TIM-barrel fold metal-dependent hydrolase